MSASGKRSDYQADVAIGRRLSTRNEVMRRQPRVQAVQQKKDAAGTPEFAHALNSA